MDRCNCGEGRTELDGEVPSLEQFSAQHSRADADSALRAFMSAALQQSMSPIKPFIPHVCSLECSGVPAKAPPATINRSSSEVSRIPMVSLTLWNSCNRCQCTTPIAAA